MSGDRIFTEEELQAMTDNELDQLAKRLNGNEKAQGLLKTIESINDGTRVAYMDFTAAVLGYIQDTMGSDAFEEAVRRYGDILIKPMKSWKEEADKKTFKNLIMEFASMLRVQSGRGFKKVEEDEEKITMHLDPCGSGGRMRRSGHYGPPHSFPRVKEPHHLSFSRSDFPHYCRQCAILHAQMPIEIDGALWPVIEPGKTDQDQCTFYFYKDPNDIPEEYYTRVGKEKVIK